MDRSNPARTAQLLYDGDDAAWSELTKHTESRSEPPDLWPELAAQMRERKPIDQWLAQGRQHIESDEAFFTKGGAIRGFETWLVRSALGELPPLDPETLRLRVMLIQSDPGNDGGFADAQELLRDVEAAARASGSEALKQLGPEVELLVAKGAFTVDDYEAARSAARGAARTFQRQRNTGRYWFAQRRVAAACVGLGLFEEAFEIFDKALRERGPLFGGGGVTVSRTTHDPQLEAVHEMVAICAWADLWTAEYVRAIGGLAERWNQEDEATVGLLWREYEEALTRLFTEGSNPESDIEVVVRHSGQRGLVDTPARALVAYLKEFPDDEWAQKQLDIVGRHARLDMLKAKLEHDTDVAIASLFDMFDDVVARNALEDGNFGFQVSDALIDALLAQKDERAVDVQQRLLDHKLDTWGECPAAWLERQNLGSILSALGRKDEARPLIEDALMRLREQFGDDHPHVQMAKRNLARVDE